MKLSICVITMNRATQLKEALESCLACELSADTEFVVIDNASTDDTEQVVNAVLKNCGYSYYYEKLSENLGVGGGRNYAFAKSGGEYVYMLDDDAVIDCENNPRFFARAIEVMDKHQDIVTLTTQIYDTAWEKNRVECKGRRFAEGLYKCQMFCGGSHFLRKSFYIAVPYLPNKYGYEEMPPSLRAMNSGKINTFCPGLLIIHKPAMNKWNWDDEKNHELLIKGIALPYAIKKMMYPRAFRPLLSLAHKLRIKKCTSNIPNFKKRVRGAVDAFCKEYAINERIRFFTVCSMVRDFGLSVF